MLNTIDFGLIHCFHYSQTFQMKGIDTYFAYLELQPIIPRDI